MLRLIQTIRDRLTADPRLRLQLALAGLMAVCAGALAVGGPNLDLDWQLALWGGWALVAGAWLVGGGRRLLGPMVRFELVRLSRQTRFLFLRLGFAVFLILVLGVVYARWRTTLPPGGNPSSQELTRFGQMFFLTFLAVEFAVALLLTPAYVAGALVEEKQRNTLEFLLATDLDRREIVLSKLVSRLANLGLLVLVGLPILSVTPFFGGIEPELVVGGFAVLGITMVSLAGLSILHSVHAATTRNAIGFTYLTTAAYVVGTWWAWSAGGKLSEAGWHPALECLVVGNPVVMGQDLLASWRMGMLSNDLPGAVIGYGIFHLLATVLCVTWAALRLGAETRSAGAGRKRLGAWRRSIGRDPLLWKEIHLEPGLRLGLLGKVLVLGLVAVSFQPAYEPVKTFVRKVQVHGYEAAFRDQLGSDLHSPLPPFKQPTITAPQGPWWGWVQLAGTLVSCLTIVAVGVRAAGAITGERDRQTLDSLLTTPYFRDAILFSKWLGCVLSVRWAWLWLGLIWGLAAASGAIHPLAVVLLAAAWFVFASLAAMVGLWFSTYGRTTLRATVATLVVLPLVSFGHFLLYACFLPIFYFSGPRGADFPQWLVTFQKYGLTPPLTLQALAFRREDLVITMAGSGSGMGITPAVSAMCGVVVWAALAWLFWTWTASRFRTATGGWSAHPLLSFPKGMPILEPLTAEEPAAEEVPAEAPTAEAPMAESIEGEPVADAPEAEPMESAPVAGGTDEAGDQGGAGTT